MTNSICLECISRGLCRMAGAEQEGVEKCVTFHKDPNFMPDKTTAEQLAKLHATQYYPKSVLNETFDWMFGKKDGVCPLGQDKPLRDLPKLEEWSL